MQDKNMIFPPLNLWFFSKLHVFKETFFKELFLDKQWNTLRLLCKNQEFKYSKKTDQILQKNAHILMNFGLN